MMYYLWRFYTNFSTKEELPWVHLIWKNYYGNRRVPVQARFWWKDNMKQLNCYKGIAQATVGQGDTIIFWQDLWNGKVLWYSWTHQYSFTNWEDTTLIMLCFATEWTSGIISSTFIWRGLHIVVWPGYLFASATNKNDANQWKYIWWSGQYRATKAYKAPYRFTTNPPYFPMVMVFFMSTKT